MKKTLTIAFFLILMMLGQSIALANIFDPEPDQPAKPEDPRPIVALLFVNNAKTTYDNDLTDKIMTNFDNLLKSKYIVVPGTKYVELLSKQGIVDITTAERTDIVDAFRGENVDYVLYCELQPFVRKEKITFFTQGINMTAIIPIKIISLKSGKYLYNGKFTEFASDSTMIGSVGNKSVSLKALDKTIEQMNSIIAARLPETK
ncbi:MAG: hypothetical protein H6Q74_1352 [Firmicutes bacterium]|nr:hypothetical protein [Bacillota bacterium]